MFRRTAFLLILAGILVGALPGAAQAARKTVVLRSAPVAMGGFNVEFPKLWVPTPKRDGYVVGMDARLVDTRGKAVTIRDVMLHHVVFYKRIAPASQSACAGKSQEAFYGTGEEKEQLRLPQGYGYPVAKRERWKMNAMLMSHSLRSVKVRVEYTVTIETGTRLEPVIPLWVRANGCGDAVSYPVWGGGEPGAVDTRTYDWRVPFDARIVAVGGHLHGGAKDMFLSQPECGGRRLLDTTPRYGMPDNLYYTARPILHEPGPVDTRYFLSATGIQVRRGETLTATGIYDDTKPHTRVMSIMHVYLAKHAAPATQDCAPLPADAQQLVKDEPVRLDPPDVSVPLNMLGDDGHTHEITALPWPLTPLGNPASVALKDNAFDPPYVQLKSGSNLTWSFDDAVAHNVTFASGPMLQGSPTLAGGKTFTTQFTRAGRYELFCYLHPLQMHQVIDVVD
jgi:Copper binding proteins, plastocyanin/azurin family